MVGAGFEPAKHFRATVLQLSAGRPRASRHVPRRGRPISGQSGYVHPRPPPSRGGRYTWRYTSHRPKNRCALCAGPPGRSAVMSMTVHRSRPASTASGRPRPRAAPARAAADRHLRRRARSAARRGGALPPATRRRPLRVWPRPARGTNTTCTSRPASAWTCSRARPGWRATASLLLRELRPRPGSQRDRRRHLVM